MFQVTFLFNATNENIVVYVHNHDMFHMAELKHYGSIAIVLSAEGNRQSTKFSFALHQISFLQRQKTAVKGKYSCGTQLVNLGECSTYAQVPVHVSCHRYYIAVLSCANLT